MRIVLDGARLLDLPAFIDAVAGAITGDSTTPRYFGFDLHSLGDCLQGGFLGEPPYEISVRAAEPMIAAFGREGLARYCDDMLAIIGRGGRGLVREDARPWYEQCGAAARDGRGDTLLDLLMETIQLGPASLLLLSESGRILGSSRDSTARIRDLELALLTGFVAARVMAAAELARMGTPGIEVLARVAVEPTHPVDARISAAAAIPDAATGVPLEPVAEALLRDDDPVLCYRAIRMCVRLGLFELTPAIEQLRGDPRDFWDLDAHIEVGAAADRALGYLRRREVCSTFA